MSWSSFLNTTSTNPTTSSISPSSSSIHSSSKQPILFQYMSDIHLEFYKDAATITSQMQIKSPILILAGDIGNPYQYNYATFLSFCANHYQKIFLIAGNHEYYQKNETMEQTRKQIMNVISLFPNITFLHNSYEEYLGICWIGSTMWTHIINPQYTINDTTMIPELTVDKVNELHLESKEFIGSTLHHYFQKPCVVITHHLPLLELTLPKFKQSFYSKYNQWFATDDMTDIIENQSNILAWVYGHTHEGSIQTFYNREFLCNPFGYPHEKSIPMESFQTVFRLPIALKK